jgi:hypothetical protein
MNCRLTYTILIGTWLQRHPLLWTAVRIGRRDELRTHSTLKRGRRFRSAVYHLGNFAMGLPKLWAGYWSALNGRITLILGNHVAIQISCEVTSALIP